MARGNGGREKVRIGQGPRIRAEPAWLVALAAIVGMAALAGLVVFLTLGGSSGIPTPTAASPPLPIVALAPTATPTPTPTPTSTPVPMPTSTPVPMPTIVPASVAQLLSKPWVQGTLLDDLQNTWANQAINEFHLSTDGSTVFASSSWGLLYQSSDQGRTWRVAAKSAVQCSPDTRKNDTGPHSSLYFDAADPKKILGRSCLGWWRSENGGESWVLSELAPPAGGLIVYPGVLYSGRFRSEDDGQTWREVSEEYPVLLGTPGYPSALYYFRSMGGPDWSVSLFISKDGAASWNRAAIPQPKEEFIAAGFDSAAPPNIYLGWIEAGLFRANALQPEEWIKMPWPATAAGRKGLAFHPTHPDVLAVTSDKGVFVTFDGGGSWVPLHQAGYQVGNIILRGIPPISGVSHRSAVVTGAERPTICIGSDAGPWCHPLR